MRYLILLFTLISGAVIASGNDTSATAGAHASGTASVAQGDIVGATLTGGSSKTLAYGPDNDINDCMAHWSALIVTFPKRNKFCERLEFVRWAEHPQTHTLQSIKIMCSGNMGVEVFDTTQECVTVFTPEDTGATPPITGPDGDGTRPDEAGKASKEGYGGPDLRDIVQTRIEQHTEEYESLEQRLDRMEAGNRAAAEKRRDYAQQTIERLEDESER